MESVVLRLRYSDFIKFAFNEDKQREANRELIISKIPGLEYKGQNKKRIIADQFKEIVRRRDSRLIS